MNKTIHKIKKERNIYSILNMQFIVSEFYGWTNLYVNDFKKVYDAGIKNLSTDFKIVQQIADYLLWQNNENVEKYVFNFFELNGIVYGVKQIRSEIQFVYWGKNSTSVTFDTEYFKCTVLNCPAILGKTNEQFIQTMHDIGFIVEGYGISKLTILKYIGGL